MKITDYTIEPISDGSLILGVNSANPQETVLFSGAQSAGTTANLASVIELESSDILDLDNGSLLLPVSDAGKYYEVTTVIMEFTAGLTQYTAPSNIELSGCFNAVVSSGLITGATDAVAIAKSSNNLSGTSTVVNSITVPSALLISSDTAPTLGDGTLRVIVFYNLRTFGA